MPNSVHGIPKIIHQTFKTAELPDDYARYRETVRANHTSWERWLWTDEDNRRFIAEEHAWFLETYDSYKHSIERVDAVRYFILYTYGGVYIDLDMECLKPIDDLLIGGEIHFSLLASPTIDDTVIGNAVMAAPREHAFFGFLTKRLPQMRQSDVTHADIMNNTGPAMLTRQVGLFQRVFAINVIGLDRICGLSVLGQNPALGGRGLDEIRDQKLLHFIHHHTNAWNVQHLPPSAPVDGYVVFRECDIAGLDLDYVEYDDGAYDVIVDACNRNPDAIGFNYNGFLKGGGGRLVSCASDHRWLKPGIVPWVCVKKDHVARVTRWSIRDSHPGDEDRRSSKCRGTEDG